MILNVSGRTDIVGFYSEWFMNRFKEGYVDVRNPFYPKLVNRIYFEDVDAIMFCTKNPLPIINHLKKINKPILFHITLTPYNKDVEPNVTSKKEVIEGIKKISNIIGIDNVYVRYDPIFISKKYKNWVARKERKSNCVQMIDIGVYNSCKLFCKCCYVNFDKKLVNDNFKKHNPKFSLLIC